MKTTNEVSHTPGPWVFGPDPLKEIEGTFIIGDNGRDFVAKIETISNLNEHGGTSERLRNSAMQIEKANARLIASAPELLEALEIIANTQYRTNKAGKVDRIEIDHCIRIAKAAITKAKGL